MVHTLTDRSFSISNLIKAQYTALFVSSLICQNANIRNTGLFLLVHTEQNLKQQKPKARSLLVRTLVTQTKVLHSYCVLVPCSFHCGYVFKE